MDISSVIFQAEEIIYYVSIQNYVECSRIIVKMLENIQSIDVLSQSLLDGDSELTDILKYIMSALEKNDMILVADIMKDAFIPCLKKYVYQTNGNDFKLYRTECTSSGYLTLYSKIAEVYLHSNVDPMEEARVMMEFVYHPRYDCYAVWGCGLGYHIYQLFEIANKSIEIHVFDSNKEVFELAKQAGIMNQIMESKIHLVIDEDARLFSKMIANPKTGIFIHYPSVRAIKNEAIRGIMEGFFPKWNNTVQQAKELEINFRFNQKKNLKCVDELYGEFNNQEVVLVAGGPSLDENLDWLRSATVDKKIVVVSRVLKKLLGLGIIPNYAVAMESNRISYEQIKDIQCTSVPIILDSTAYWEFAQRYPGEKYIAFQEGYAWAERFASENNKRLYKTGGSVTTLALDILLQMNAKNIYLVGADMAYPGGITHAADTVRSMTINTEGMQMVEAVNGERVATTIQLNNCRKWIENRIAEYPNVSVFNLSKNGAYISGTKPFVV